jgi:hypothetical protein
MADYCPGCMMAYPPVPSRPVEKLEIEALEKCDVILAGLQDHMRGACRVRAIREIIRQRLDPAEDSLAAAGREIRFLTRHELNKLEQFKEGFDILWAILVMLKRDFDQHRSDSNKLEIDTASWREAMRIVAAMKLPS